MATATSTTADSWNRQRDKMYVETMLNLREEGCSDTILIPVDSSSSTSSSAVIILARGYNRVVFGDHGAYVELDKSQVGWASFPRFNKSKAESAPERYYDEYFTADGAVMLYAQLKRVGAKPPPGAGSVDRSAQRRQADEPYADYRPGFFYIAAKSVRKLEKATSSESKQQQQQAKAKKNRLQ